MNHAIQCRHLESGQIQRLSNIDEAATAVCLWTRTAQNPHNLRLIRHSLSRAVQRPVHNHAYGFAWEPIK